MNINVPAPIPPCALHDAACGADSLPARRCQVYSAWMVPSVAGTAVSCMNNLTGNQVCDPVRTSACGHGALSLACPDPDTVGPLCEIAAAPCKSSQSECVALLSGLTADGQDAVARCVANGCPSGLYSCVEGLATSY